MLKVIRVTGDSLAPDYREGDFVLVTKLPFPFVFPRQGDVVVFLLPPYGRMIKRVERVDRQSGEIFVRGEGVNSVDSRRFGPIRKEALIGKVIWHIRKPSK